ncbi:MAG TPA: cytochrome c biogenesis protein CcsA [Gemmatimonadota bacterium]|nr:cytochrome c biogenesis protein CcsA [Gemmatimonadota bacterium]
MKIWPGSWRAFWATLDGRTYHGMLWARPWIGWLAVGLMVGTFALVFWWVPLEAIQGWPQKIFYIHVPSAWIMYSAFAVVFVSSIMYLWQRTRLWDVFARCAAEIGFLFCTLALATGMMWGKPIWGTFWTWDARLTSTLILWFIYGGYLLLRAYARADADVARLAAIVGIIGFLDVPIIHMSVVWWRTLHPEPVVMIIDDPGGGLPVSMLITLLVSLASFTLVFLYLFIQRVWQERTAENLALLEALMDRGRPEAAA